MKIKTVLLPLFAAVLFAVSSAAVADDYIVPQRILDLHNYACENGSAVDCQSYHQLLRGNEKAKRVRQQRREREERKEKQRQERELRAEQHQRELEERAAQKRREQEQQRREQEQQRIEQEKKKAQQVRMRDAVQNSDIAEVNRLLDDGVDVNAFDENGNTALHLATLNGNIEIVKALLLSGANLNAANNDGNTVLDLAFTGKNIEVIRVLHKANEEQMELKAEDELRKLKKAETDARQANARQIAAIQAKLKVEEEVKQIKAEMKRINAELYAEVKARVEAEAEAEEEKEAKYLIWFWILLIFSLGGWIHAFNSMRKKQKGAKE